jgi:hypothetical protein
LAKDLSTLFTFLKSQHLVSLIRCLVLLVSISVISVLNFTICFYILILGLACSCFLRTWSTSLGYLFVCMSKALKVSMSILPSCRMHLILWSMCSASPALAHSHSGSSDGLDVHWICFLRGLDTHQSYLFKNHPSGHWSALKKVWFLSPFSHFIIFGFSYWGIMNFFGGVILPWYSILLVFLNYDLYMC